MSNERFTDPLVIQIIKPEDIRDPTYRDGLVTGRAGKPIHEDKKDKLIWLMAYETGQSYFGKEAEEKPTG